MVAVRELTGRIDPQLASQKARMFVHSLGATPEDKARRLQELYPVGHFDQVIDGKAVAIPYLSSDSIHPTRRGITQRPTVVIFPGVFQEVPEMRLEMATIAHVFNVNTVVLDYASLASRGLRHMINVLPSVINRFETERGAPRFIFGESLGGLVAQAVAFESADRTNLKGMVLSHTAPPDQMKRSAYVYLKATKALSHIVSEAFAHRTVNQIVGNAAGDITKGATSKEARELQEVQRYFEEEKIPLRRRRGDGFFNAGTDAADIARKAKPTDIFVEVVASPEDSIMGNRSQDDWRKSHRRANVTFLPGTEGHFKPGLQKPLVFFDTVIPKMAKVLNQAA